MSMLFTPFQPLSKFRGRGGLALGPLAGAVRQILSGFNLLPDGRINLNVWYDNRAASLWLPDHEGIVREVPPGFPAIVDTATGRTPRIVRNYVSSPEDLTGGNWTTNRNAVIVDKRTVTFTEAASTSWADTDAIMCAFRGGRNPDFRNGKRHLVARVKLSGNPGETVQIRLQGEGGEGPNTNKHFRTITLTETPTWYSVDWEAVADPPMWGPSVYIERHYNHTASVVYVDGIQVEDVSGASTGYLPSEYIGTAEFAYFTTQNATTVDAHCVVTDAVGADLPVTGEWAFAHYPQTDNWIADANDFDLSTTSWTGSGSPATTTDDAVAPNGLVEADLLASQANTLDTYIQNITTTASADYTFSIYAKQNTSTKTRIGLYATGVNWDGYIELAWSAGVPLVSSTGGALVGYALKEIGNGWWRLILTVTASTTTSQCRIQPGKGALGESIWAWGAQVEERGFVTPIVQSVGAPLTRDACDIQHVYDGYFNQAEGTLIFDWTPLHDAAGLSIAEGLFGVNTGGAGVLYLGTGTPGKTGTTDGTHYSLAYPSTPYANGDSLRAAVRWSVSNNELQAGLRSNDGSWTWAVPQSYDGAFSQNRDISLFRNFSRIGTCKDLKLYNKALSQSEIEVLP